jgi:hypothetical protein
VKAVKVFIFFATSFLYETRLPAVSAAWIKHQLQLNVDGEMWMATLKLKCKFENICISKQADPADSLEHVSNTNVTLCITCCVQLIYKIHLNIFFKRMCALSAVERWTAVEDFGLQYFLDNNTGKNTGFLSVVLS